MHTELNSGFRTLTRYDEYYLSGGDLFLLVERHVFRVHRYFFERESTYFKGKLATPASPGSTRPGTNESNAILLEDVKVHEFARFLWVFYNPKYSLYNTSVADWTAILDLAHRWAFPEVKALAVRELEKQSMPDIERVVVYQDNEVDPNLLIRCYAALCEREEPLTPAEGRLMGIDTALTIAQLREMARRSPADCRSPTSANIRGSDLYLLVRELFRIAEPIRDDDSLPQTPLGGPIWPGLPTTASTQSSPAQPPPAKSTIQATMPALTPQLPIQTATPPLEAQELETRPLDLKSPPLKPERPQVITNPALAKVNQQTDTSRPNTPTPETPPAVTGEKKKKKKASKNEKLTKTVLAPEMDPTKTNTGKLQASAPTGIEGTMQQQQQQQLQDGEKENGQASLGKADETKEADAPGAVEFNNCEKDKEKEQDKAGVVTGGGGVSTDIPNTTADPTQEVKLDPLAQILLAARSPLSPNHDKHDYLKSPEEWKNRGVFWNFSS